MLNYESILREYYIKGSDLYNLLVGHSTHVADKAMDIIRKSSLETDEHFVYEAAMLHDIGIFKTYAPTIFCLGNEKYIRHGMIGRELLENMGYHRHALVCERHTGSGMTRDEIIASNLPLPHRDMLPVTMEEKLICYADKFFSKSEPGIEKTIDQIRNELSRFGQGASERFEVLHTMFSVKD